MSTPIQTTRLYRSLSAGPDARYPQLAQILNRRLLVVEDDLELWPIIDRAGPSVDQNLVIEFAGSPEEAIERLTSGVRFDALLVDNCLPNPGDGDSLRSPTEELQPWAAFGMMSGKTRARPSYCDFLAKPFTMAQCGAFIGNLLRR